MLGKETRLCHAEPALHRNRRAWIVDAWRDVFAALAHGVVFDHERLFATGDELHQPGVYALEGCIHQRLFAAEYAGALVVQVQHVTNRAPLSAGVEQVGGGLLGMGGRRENDGQPAGGENPEEPAAGGVGPEVRRIEDAVVEPIASVRANAIHPPAVMLAAMGGIGHPHGGDGAALVFAGALGLYRQWTVFAMTGRCLDDFHHERPPRHELLDVLDLDVVGPQCVDVSEKVLGKRAAVGVAALAAP